MNEDLSVTNSSSSAMIQGSSEDVVGKYKRLLSMARSSLEANQAQLASKDQQISQLVAALEEEKSKRSTSKISKDDEGYQYPRRILCRVDVVNIIWVLIEYESSPDEWKSFTNDQALQDFIKSIPGVPLLCPQKCLSADESIRLIEDTKRKTDKVMEEFRRYKVRMEINLKQKSAEIKTVPGISSSMNGISNFQGQITGNNALSVSLERALSLGAMNSDENSGPVNEIARLRSQLIEQESRWKHSYEKLAKELECLKTKGAESQVAAQWRQRYEMSVKEKEDLLRRLNLLLQFSDEISSSGLSAEQLFLDVEEDYKSLRRRLHELILEFRQKTAKYPDSISKRSEIGFIDELSRVLEYYAIDTNDMDDSKLVLPRHYQRSPHIGDKSAADGYVAGKGMVESKVQYVRQMVFQYLVCSEPEVKSHIEAALIALFRFTEEERGVIESRRKEESQDTFSSFTNLFGSFTASTT